MAFVEDFAPYFADFGSPATLAGQPCTVIFDNLADTQTGSTTAVPQVQVQSSQVPEAVFGAALVITSGRGAGSYTVREAVPDGTGMHLLFLTEA